MRHSDNPAAYGKAHGSYTAGITTLTRAKLEFIITNPKGRAGSKRASFEGFDARGCHGTSSFWISADVNRRMHIAPDMVKIF